MTSLVLPTSISKTTSSRALSTQSMEWHMGRTMGWSPSNPRNGYVIKGLDLALLTPPTGTISRHCGSGNEPRRDCTSFILAHLSHLSSSFYSQIGWGVLGMAAGDSTYAAGSKLYPALVRNIITNVVGNSLRHASTLSRKR